MSKYYRIARTTLAAAALAGLAACANMAQIQPGTPYADVWPSSAVPTSNARRPAAGAASSGRNSPWASTPGAPTSAQTAA